MSLDSLILDKTLSRPSHLPYVEATLNYLKPMAEKPFNYTYEPPVGVLRENVEYESHPFPIRDARAIAPNLSLNREGFVLTAHHSSVRDFYNEDELHQVYYAEAEKLLAEVTGADKVIVFDHNLRSSQRAQDVSGVKEPVKRVHNDFTAKSGYSRARAVLTALEPNLDALLNQRFSIVNVWRPIAHPVQESPLAVCDARSIASMDWVATDLIYRDRVGETYLITHNPAHQWFYFPHMQPDEVLLIKCFDSAEGEQARFTAHTAFDDPTSPTDAIGRASIELRSLVFYGE